MERVSIEPAPNPENLRYLQTKRERLGHLLDGLDDDAKPDEDGPQDVDD